MRRRTTGARAWRAGVRSGAVAVLTAVLLLSAGCVPATTPPAPASTPAGALPEGVTVELRQARSDVAARQASVRIVNGSSRTLRVGAVSVSDPRFEAPAERVVDRTSALPPGRAIDVRVQLADVACAPATSGTDAGADASVTLDLEIDGVAETVTAPLSDPVPFVAALHDRECVRERVGRAASVSFGRFVASPRGEAAALELVIEPAAGGSSDAAAVALVGIRETNLLTFEGLRPGGLFPLGLLVALGEAASNVTLPLVPARCDPHAVLEDKRGTVFRLLVEIDGKEGSFDVAASEELRGRLLEWVATWCGFGSG